MKLKITIPEGLKDIKLYQYQKFAEIEEKIELIIYTKIR